MAEYPSIISRYEAASKNLKGGKKEATPHLAEYKKYPSIGFNIPENAEREYVTGTITLKRRIQYSMLAEKLIFGGKKYRSPCHLEDQELILNYVKDLVEIEKGQSRIVKLLMLPLNRG